MYLDLKKSSKFCQKYFDVNAVKNTSLGSTGYVRTQRINNINIIIIIFIALLTIKDQKRFTKNIYLI